MCIHRSLTGVILLVTAIGTLACSKVSHYELSRFIAPETCGSCHEEIYRQWHGSMHNLAHADVLYRTIALHDLKGLTDPDELKEAQLCVKCHTPLGYLSGMPATTADHVKDIPAVAAAGVQCDYCHSSTGARSMYNADIDLDPGHGEEKPGVKRGPLKNASSDFHDSAYSEFHTRSEICGACHDVRHVVFGTRLETPYEEWKAGPYGDRSSPGYISCQGCHMYQRPGVPATGSTPRPDNPGTSASGGPRRAHVFTHYFAGANTVIPAREKSPLHAALALERLKHAATIGVVRISDGRIAVTVKNTGAGHRIPTGLSNVRQMWIELVVTTPSGRELYRSGTPNARGVLPSDTKMYMTVFGDGAGKPTMNVSKARLVLKDNRIAPGAAVTEHFTLPQSAEERLAVTARLCYRLAPQESIDAVMGVDVLKLPVVVMAEDRKILVAR